MRRGVFILSIVAVGCYFALTKKSPRRTAMPYPDAPKEYRLPANDVPQEVRKRLHPWIAGFIGLTPEAANRRVAERWASIDRPSLRELRDTLSKFKVEAIVDYEEGGMIKAYRPTKAEPGAGDYWYLPAPLGAEEISRRLAPGGLDANDGLREFLFHFTGLAEEAGTAGDFVYSEVSWPLFTDSWDGSIQGFDAWRNSLMFYHGRNGDHVLMRRDGRLAWWVFPERKVKPLAESIDEFVKVFNEHRKISYPYDSYGPPDYAR